jgi:6-phosphogluconolactonase
MKRLRAGIFARLKPLTPSALMALMKLHLLLRSFVIVICLAAFVARADYLVYFGTYTGAKSKGIYAFRMSDEGKLTPLGLAAETPNPTYLAVHPNKKFLYSINEVSKFGEKKAGFVSAFSIDAKTGMLTALNQQTAGGTGPCHIALDEKGRCAVVANYGGGSVEALPLKKDGSLGEPGTFTQHAGTSVNKSRQEGPHGHCILVDPSQRFALACDLGLDQVLIYKLDVAKGTLTPNNPAFATIAPGSGPRHIAFHPNGKFAYVISEMLCTMTAFSWDSRAGALKELQTISTLPGELQRGYSTAEVYVHPSGKFVYGSNRGHNSIVGYACDAKTGRLTLIEHTDTQGKTPRHFGIDPSGKFLLAENQDSGTVVVFKIDSKTGKLTPTGEKVEVPSPVAAVFVPVK